MRERSPAVYIITNAPHGVLYTGVTSDLITRGRQHRDGEIPGFSQKWHCKRLVWWEDHAEMDTAIHREKQIKRWRREWKFALIEANNPDWRDLWPGLVGFEPLPWDGEIKFDSADVPTRGGPG